MLGEGERTEADLTGHVIRYPKLKCHSTATTNNKPLSPDSLNLIVYSHLHYATHDTQSLSTPASPPSGSPYRDTKATLLRIGSRATPPGLIRSGWKDRMNNRLQALVQVPDLTAMKPIGNNR